MNFLIERRSRFRRGRRLSEFTDIPAIVFTSLQGKAWFGDCEAVDDDRELAEAGMSDYAKILDSDVMLDAWCELPRPPVIGRVTPRRVDQLPFDIPHIPTDEEIA